MFYEPIFEHGDYKLVRRPDTDNLAIAWYSKARGRYRRKSTGTGDPEEARRRMMEYIGSRSRPPRQTPETAAVMELLVDHVERVLAGGGSPHAPKAALLHWLEFTREFDILHVADLTYETQERYVAWRRDTLRSKNLTASNGTIKRELGVMKAALRSAWKRGLLTAAPHVITLPTPPPRDRFLREDEIARLIAACTCPHLRLYVMLALGTLQRPIALLSLRAGQVDLGAGIIDFNEPGRVQSNKRRPVVPIPAALRPGLERAVGSSVSGHVIEYQGRPIRSVRYGFSLACGRAGLDGVTPYVLRHTGATLLAASGVSIRQIAGMLGHSEQRTTELYAKHHPSFLREARDELDGILSRALDAESAE